MTIELFLEGQIKRFVADFIPARIFREAIQAQKILNKETITEDDLDIVIQLVVNVYGKQFTVDEFYDGTDVRKMLKVITDTITFVVSGVSGDTHE